MDLFSFGREQKPVEKLQASQKSQKMDKSIFQGKESVSLKEGLWRYKKSSPYVPGSGGAKLTDKQREDIFKRTKEYGSYNLKKENVSKIIKDLKEEKFHAKTSAEKLEKDRMIRDVESKWLGK